MSNATPDFSKLTKAQMIALFESGALKVATPKREKSAWRVANPEKISPIGRRTPLAGFDDTHGKGLTYASWLDVSAGEPVKRFAVRPLDGSKSWLLVDTRGITKDDVRAIAREFFGKDVTGKVVTGATGGVDGRPAVAVPVVLFAKASK